MGLLQETHAAISSTDSSSDPSIRTAISSVTAMAKSLRLVDRRVKCQLETHTFARDRQMRVGFLV